MRFLHTGDWHIGKNLAGYSLLTDQHATFQKIVEIAKQEQVDAVVIAGDLYDRTIPSEAATRELMNELVTLNIKASEPLLAISGNHDSATRLGVGSQWFASQNFYLNTDFQQVFQPVSLKDTQFFLLPFFGLQEVRNYFGDDRIRDVNSAMKRIVKRMKTKFDPTQKHVLVAHFFAAGSTRTADSETMIEVGGLSAVNTSLLSDFDYVALGHLHNKNALNEERIKYSGSPMKFSVSEAHMEKGVWIVDTNPFSIKWVKIPPIHDIHVIEESMKTLTSTAFANQYPKDDYYAIRLTDRQIIPDVMHRLRQYYPYIISLGRKYGFDSPQQKKRQFNRKLAPDKLFANFYRQTVGVDLDTEQQQIVKKSLEQVQKEN
ncbi:exonuclease SbcCD subunit D [uncultured Limosilactobacillus sp.]|uniref:exonuclease SbcCD subunit D n=1 Tax=uncultured Limosilactobacillus sp. TaxID=2837629 RepID=UPI0025F02DEF|nr:exonuclease SbcCD subunit D [uncultured Limosilactobacillus sp.]